MKTKIFSILMVLVMTIMAIPGSVFAYDGSGDGGNSSVGTLILDNKDTTTWQRVVGDGKYGTFTYNASGATFVWSLDLQGADANVAYRLIYFANPYPGTGKLIWAGVADSAGEINVTNVSSGAIQPNCNLPFASDSNGIAVSGIDRTGVPDFYPVGMTEGAKIWVVPASCYDDAGQKLNAWNNTVTAQMFFETGLIKYTYTSTTSGSSVGLITTIIEPTVGILVVPNGDTQATTIDFGNVMIGNCSDGEDFINITNTGNVHANISRIVSTGFYTDCLKLKTEGGTWVSATSWSYSSLGEGVTIKVYAKVCPTAAYATAPITGSIIFLAEYAPTT